MRTRPQPNPRRGILRATAVVILLLALVIGAILLIEALTAPAARAPTVPPTVPPTPGPRATPRLLPTRPVPHATPTPKKKRLALQRTSPQAGVLEEVSGHWRDHHSTAGRTREPADGPGGSASPSDDGRITASFEPGGTAYRSRLDLITSATGAVTHMGYGDPFVRPVWSHDNRFLLYVRVAQTRAFPGARWSLVRLDVRSKRSRVLVRADAMTLIPLGWSDGSLVYLIGNSTDTSIFERSRGGNRFISIFMPQPLTSATLSPDGRYIAAAAPSNCSATCTLDVFDLQEPAAWVGPTGLPDEYTLAWSADSRSIVTVLKDKLAVIGADSHDVHVHAIPSGLPHVWTQPMRAVVTSRSIDLTNSVTHQSYERRT